MQLQGRRRLVLATTSDYQALVNLEVTESFNKSIRVDPVKTPAELKRVLKERNAFQPATLDRIERTLAGNPDPFDENAPEVRLDLGVKKILEDLYEAENGARLDAQRQRDAMELEGGQGSANQRELDQYEETQRANKFVRLIWDRMTKREVS